MMPLSFSPSEPSSTSLLESDASMALDAHQPLPQQQEEQRRVEAAVDARLQQRLAAQLEDAADVVLACQLDGCFESLLESAASTGRHELLAAWVARLQEIKTSGSNRGRYLKSDICKDISSAWLSAAYGGHPQCIKVMLDACTSPAAVVQLLDVRDREECHEGQNALMIAAMHGHVQCLHELLKYDADGQVTAFDDRGRTALMMAAAHGYAECVRRLLNHSPNAQVAAVDNDGENALILAMPDTACTQLLLTHSPITQMAVSTADESVALDLAAKYGRADCLSLLLPHNVSKQQLDQALLKACQRLPQQSEWHALDLKNKQRVLGLTECVELLLAAGAMLPAEADEEDREILRPIIQRLAAKARIPDIINETVAGLARVAADDGHRRRAREEDAASGPSSKCTRPNS